MIGAPTTIYCRKNQNISIRVLPGHFAMTHSHTNYYVDIMEPKLNQAMAYEAASSLTEHYLYSQPVDAILCMDGSEIIGAYMAEKFSQKDIFSVNSANAIHVISPENEKSSQMILRDNIQPMVNGKNVLILSGSILTGTNIKRASQCIRYYGGNVVGICSVFSMLPAICGFNVSHLFSQEDLPDYAAYDYSDCPLCAAGVKIDALANCYGYSKL